MDKSGGSSRPPRRTFVPPPPAVPPTPNFFLQVTPTPLVRLPPPPAAPARVHVPLVRAPRPRAVFFPGIGSASAPPRAPTPRRGTRSSGREASSSSSFQQDFSPVQEDEAVRAVSAPQRVGRLETQRFEFNVSNRIGVEDLDQLSRDMEDLLSQAGNNMNIQRGDQVSIRITGRDTSGIEFTATVTFRDWGEIDADTLLDEIENVLISDRELTGDLEIEVTVFHPFSLGLQGRNEEMTESVIRMSIRKSTGVVQINPPGDEINGGTNCTYQFVYIGLAYLISTNKIAPLPHLKLDSVRSYLRLSSDGDRFNVRRKGVALMMKLYGQLQDKEFFLRIEAEFKVQLVIYNASVSLDVIWPLQVPVYNEYPQIAGIGYSSDEGLVSHVDFCSRPESLMTRINSTTRGYSYPSRQCAHCFELYKVRKQCSNEHCRNRTSPFCAFCHACPNICTTCCSQNCGKIVENPCDVNTSPFMELVKCQYCHMKMFSPRCATLHPHVCKFTMKSRCAACLKSYHGNTPCDVIQCYMCNMKFPRQQQVIHECYIQKEKANKPIDSILAYDFECVRDDSNFHIPYLCTAVILCSPKKECIVKTMKSLYPFEEHRGETVFYFWGLADETAPTWVNSVLSFWLFLLHPLLRGFTCFAHNSKAYDAIIVKHYFALKNYYSIDVMRGRKIMHMFFEKLNQRYVDSTNFIPSALRKLSGDFGIEELKKGYFPHGLMTQSFFNDCQLRSFIIPLPSAAEFEPNYKNGSDGRKEEKEFLSFYEQQTQICNQEGGWNLKREAVQYCISDTLLLAECLHAFRDSFMDMARSIEPSFNYDPFAYMTLPSAMMNFFLSSSIEANTIGVIDRGPILVRRQAYALFLFRQSQGYGAFDLETDNVAIFETAKQIVIYADCYATGCKICFTKYQFNQRRRMYMIECQEDFNATVTRWSRRKPFYKMCVFSKHNIEFPPSFLHQVDEHLPLDPREAYKGGKVEVFKLIHRNPLQMCDFVSEYPTTLLGKSYDPLAVDEQDSQLTWPFPCGTPVQYWHPSVDSIDESMIGIMKCKILPPRNLYAPFLSYRVYFNSTYEVIYGLCRTCMELRLWPCSHEEEERAFTGTWTCAEILHAIRLGYRVLYIVEWWQYPTQSTSLFRKFIIPFMVEKIISKRSGLVDDNNEFTEKGNRVNEYLFSLAGRYYEPDEFKNAPARRTVAKLAQNSFTGKWGEIEVHRSSRVFSDETLAEVWGLFHNSDVKMKFASVLSVERKLIFAEYEMRDSASRMARKKNDIIVAHITAYGRIMLSRLEQALGRNMIYEDTDSAMHSMLHSPAYIDGFRTGDLELEVPLAHDWVSLGRKWYTYALPTGDTVNKLKGFTLARKESLLTDSERMVNHLIDVVQRFKALQIHEEGSDKMLRTEEEDPFILIPQLLFKTTADRDPRSLFKKTITMHKKVRFFLDKMKRYVSFDDLCSDTGILDSLPFGYVDVERLAQENNEMIFGGIEELHSVDHYSQQLIEDGQSYMAWESPIATFSLSYSPSELPTSPHQGISVYPSPSFGCVRNEDDYEE